MKKRFASIALIALVPLLTGAEGEGCGGDETDPESTAQVTVDVSGDWTIDYQDGMEIEIAIGGAIYTETVGLAGGVIEIDHDGQPFQFDFDCSRPEVVCPSEVWPGEFSLDQRDAAFPRNVYVKAPIAECDGKLVSADAAECGDGTNNEECAEVCDGEITIREVETFGRISLDDTRLDVLFGVGAATNGYNCALLSLSIASATLDTTGSAEAGDWTANSMSAGEVVTGVAGGCLWAGDVDADGTIDPAVVGATIKMTTGFTADRR